MNGHCDFHTFETAVDVCGLCYGDLCRNCTLPHKGRKDSVCKDCVLAVSGVRGGRKPEVRGDRKTVKERRKTYAEAEPPEDFFQFFDDERPIHDPSDESELTPVGAEGHAEGHAEDAAAGDQVSTSEDDDQDDRDADTGSEGFRRFFGRGKQDKEDEEDESFVSLESALADLDNQQTPARDQDAVTQLADIRRRGRTGAPGADTAESDTAHSDTAVPASDSKAVAHDGASTFNDGFLDPAAFEGLFDADNPSEENEIAPALEAITSQPDMPADIVPPELLPNDANATTDGLDKSSSQNLASRPAPDYSTDPFAKQDRFIPSQASQWAEADAPTSEEREPAADLDDDSIPAVPQPPDSTDVAKIDAFRQMIEADGVGGPDTVYSPAFHPNRRTSDESSSVDPRIHDVLWGDHPIPEPVEAGHLVEDVATPESPPAAPVPITATWTAPTPPPRALQETTPAAPPPTLPRRAGSASAEPQPEVPTDVQLSATMSTGEEDDQPGDELPEQPQNLVAGSTVLPTADDDSAAWTEVDDVPDLEGVTPKQRADIDDRGSWIPPALRGSAADAEDAGKNLPQRR